MKLVFDDFLLDTDTSQLTLKGQEVALEPRVFDLLCLLVSERHRVVSKDDIANGIWQGRFTSDGAITTCIKQLRRALQDDGDAQRYIKTQRGKGFRFVAEVQSLASTPVLHNRAPPAAAPPAVQPVAHHGKPSIIIVPLQSSLTDSHSELLAEAIAHELIRALSRLRWLRVIARGTAFRFRAADTDLTQVAQQLQVRYALCGTISRLGNTRLLSVELIDCDAAEVIWAERFDKLDEALVLMQQQVVAQIIASLELYIPLHEATRATLLPPDNLNAWSHYHLGLRHMFRFTAGDNQRAADCFRQALACDQHFARAYAGLSFTRFQDAFLRYDKDIGHATAEARRFAEKSVELDGLDPFTNYNLGRSLLLECDHPGSQHWLQRSVELSPNYAQGHYSMALADTLQGKAQDCLDHSAQALHLSPLDPLLYAVYAVRALSQLHHNDLPQAQHTIDLAVHTQGAHYLIFMIAAAIYALADEPVKAGYWGQQARQRKADASQPHFFAALPFSDTDLRQTISRGLSQAGFR